MSTALETLQALETQGFTPVELRNRFRTELRILSDAYTQQMLRFGESIEESEGVLYAIMVAQSYCISRLLDLNGKLTLPQALERYAQIELENYATEESLDADKAFWRGQTLRCEAMPLEAGDQTFYKLYSPVQQRARSYQHIPANTWFNSNRRTLPRVIDFILHGQIDDGS